MNVYTIKSNGSGWYSFIEIPQGYVKIDGFNCKTDEKALEQAKKICTDDDHPLFQIILEVQ